MEIIAGVNESDSRSETTHIQGTASLNTSTGFSFSMSGDKTWTGAESVSYTNSQLNGNNIKIKSSSDTLVSGAVVNAANNLDLDIGGNLTVESKQDTSKSHSVTIGASMGGGKEGVDNGGANFNISKSSSKWVNEQTSLTGGTVNIDVENKTTLTGAMIASTTGDLTLSTGSFEYSNLLDKNRSYGIGGGVGGGVSINYDKPPEDRTSASYNLDGNYSLSDKRQKNFATIGEGTITVRDASTGSATGLEGLNRDVSIAQYETKKETGFEGNFRVDNTTVEMIGNTVDAIMNPQQAAEDLAKKAEQAYTDVAGTTSLIIAEGGELVDKTDNYLDDKGFNTDEEVKKDEEVKAQKIAEEQRKAEEADKNRIVPTTIGGKEIQGVKAGGVQDEKSSSVSQHSLGAISERSACTLSVWFMIGLDFADPNQTPKDMTTVYNSTSNDEIKKDNGYVYAAGEEAMVRGAGGTGYKIAEKSYCVNNDTNKDYVEIDNGKATQIMVNTLNEGGKINLRVTPDGGTKGGHSVKVDGYVVENNKIYMTIKDPNNGEFNRYDPERKQLFKKVGDTKKYDDRVMNRFIPVTKVKKEEVVKN